MFDETVTTMEVMEMLIKVYDRLEELSARVEELSDAVERRFEAIEARLDKVEQQLNCHTTCLNRIEENMATKTQLNRLVRVLRHNGIISTFDAEHVIAQG